MDMIKGLAHVCVVTKDISKSKQFYTEVLGFEVVHENNLYADAGAIALCFVKKGDISLELAQFMFEVPERSTGYHDHISFLVDDIDDKVESLKLKGVVFETEKPLDMDNLFEHGCRGIAFSGPDGERLELTEIL